MPLCAILWGRLVCSGGSCSAGGLSFCGLHEPQEDIVPHQNSAGTDAAERSVGVIAIIVKNRSQSAQRVNETLAPFGDMVVGRMGIPHHERDLFIITLIVDAPNDTIGALTGKLGQIEGVTVKSTLAKL